MGGIKGNTKNPRRVPRVGMGPRGRVKQRGLRILPGDTVKENDWLVAQTGVRAAYYPGMNCRVNIYNDILSNCDGTVEMTREVYIPHPTSVEAELVKKMPRGSLWFRYYVNILPDHHRFHKRPNPNGNFKL